MLITLNNRLFLALNASDQPNALALILAEVAASGLIYPAALLMPVLWVWGRRMARAALIATGVGMSLAFVFNLLLGLLWYEPRPFMIGLGHTFVPHAIENSFPSDHATFLWSLGFGLIATGASRGFGAAVCIVALLTAWARVYLGLHFPLDMAASLLVALAASGLARAVMPSSERSLLPTVEGIYETALRTFHLPPALFPRRIEQ